MNKFELVDKSERKIDKPIRVMIPFDRVPKESPIIKPLSEWIEELKHD